MLDQRTSHRYHAVVSLQPVQTELMVDGSRQQLINVTLHDGQMVRPVVAGIRPDDARALAAQLVAFADSAIRSPVEPTAYDDALSEAFDKYPAYAALHSFLAPADADVLTSDPRDLAPEIAALGDRAGALLYAHRHAASLEAGEALAARLPAMAERGERPRCGAELGLRLVKEIEPPEASPAASRPSLSPDEQGSIARVRSSLDAEIERDIAGVNGNWLEWRAALDDLTEPAA